VRRLRNFFYDLGMAIGIVAILVFESLERLFGFNDDEPEGLGLGDQVQVFPINDDDVADGLLGVIVGRDGDKFEVKLDDGRKVLLEEYELEKRMVRS
jgi:hypothetical protein